MFHFLKTTTLLISEYKHALCISTISVISIAPAKCVAAE